MGHHLPPRAGLGLGEAGLWEDGRAAEGCGGPGTEDFCLRLEWASLFIFWRGRQSCCEQKLERSLSSRRVTAECAVRDQP